MAKAAPYKSHKSRMIERRQRQLAREPGFAPVGNARVDGAIQSATALFALQGINAAEAQSKARAHVARSLPAAKPSKLYRPRPSKSDDAKYRKASV